MKRHAAGDAAAIAALREEVGALRELVKRLAALVSRQSPELGTGISTGVAAAIYGVDKTWMRKLIVRHRLGKLVGRRWSVDPHAFADLVAVTRSDRLPELRRRLPSASKRDSSASPSATG